MFNKLASKLLTEKDFKRAGVKAMTAKDWANQPARKDTVGWVNGKPEVVEQIGVPYHKDKARKPRSNR